MSNSCHIRTEPVARYFRNTRGVVTLTAGLRVGVNVIQHSIPKPLYVSSCACRCNEDPAVCRSGAWLVTVHDLDKGEAGKKNNGCSHNGGAM